MKIKYLAHAAFLIVSDAGTRIITDPYGSRDDFSYDEISEAADIVTISHDHFDHNNVAAVRGNPQAVRGTAKAKGIYFRGILTHHDNSGGQQRGNNIIMCFEVDGVKVCHLGDLGHKLTGDQAKEIGKVDVLLVPVGGYFTIDAGVASQVCDMLSPRFIIPMHYKTEKCELPISGLDDFLEGKKSIKRPGGSEAEFGKDSLPPETEIIVLKPSL